LPFEGDRLATFGRTLPRIGDVSPVSLISRLISRRIRTANDARASSASLVATRLSMARRTSAVSARPKFARNRAMSIASTANHSLSEREAAGRDLLGDAGLIVGTLGRRMLRFADVEGSVVVFAPQGAGKGVGIVEPNLLTYPGSVICTDPKGENYAITVRQRRTFGPVYCINVGDPDRSHRFNPPDVVSRDFLRAVDDCTRLAELLVPKDAGDADSHWRNRSVSILTALLLWVIEVHGDDPTRCNLSSVHEIVTAPGGKLCGAVAAPLTDASCAGAGLQPSGAEEGAGAPSAGGPWHLPHGGRHARDGD
jgi:type IV secretory pathway TraG/TraD family ATPase VirD4